MVAYYLLTYVAELGLQQRKDPGTDADEKKQIGNYLGKWVTLSPHRSSHCDKLLLFQADGPNGSIESALGRSK